jgi:hypothetical protein
MADVSQVGLVVAQEKERELEQPSQSDTSQKLK